MGIIDIGSNSVRLLIDNGCEKKKVVKTTRLAAGLQVGGLLNDDAIARTVSAVSDYVTYLSLFDASVNIFATEAVRSAQNGAEFCQLVTTVTGQSVHVLTGDEEARCAFLGAYTSGNVAIVDIGGGSTEVVVGDEFDIKYSKSVPYGIVRINDNAGERHEDVLAYIGDLTELYGVIPNCDKLIGIGGTVTNLAAICLKMEKYDPIIIHGYTMSRDEIQNVYDSIIALPLDQRGKIVGLQSSRRSTICGGIIMLLKIMEMLSIARVTASEADNLEGYGKLIGVL